MDEQEPQVTLINSQQPFNIPMAPKLMCDLTLLLRKPSPTNCTDTVCSKAILTFIEAEKRVMSGSIALKKSLHPCMN